MKAIEGMLARLAVLISVPLRSSPAVVLRVAHCNAGPKCRLLAKRHAANRHLAKLSDFLGNIGLKRARQNASIMNLI